MSADPDERFNETCPPAATEPGKADRFPLTCSWCSNSPATHLAVADWRFRDGPQRLQHMLCGTCAHGTTVLPAEAEGWWLFALTPDNPFDCAAEPLNESRRWQVEQARDCLATWDLAREGNPGIDRERVLADQLRTVLAILDELAPKGEGR